MFELHRHLDGSLRPETLLALADEHGIDIESVPRFQTGMGLMEALACFEVTLSVLQTPDSVKRVAGEMCEDAELEGLDGLEIRFAPQLHTGASPEAIVDAAIAGIDGRASLILCGLYGEPPSVLDGLVTIAAERPDVVGIDLAGGPAPAHEWALIDYAGPFGRARELGIGRTVHAAEGRSPQEIATAVNILHAQRVGHACSLLDDPAVLELVLTQGTIIEACPTSNVHTGVFDSVKSHPLAQWLALGVRAVVCTDNTLLSNVDMPEELRRVRDIDGMTDERVRQLSLNSIEGRFSRA